MASWTGSVAEIEEQVICSAVQPTEPQRSRVNINGSVG